jgi:REP element-mobilizing transposase RayT
MNRQQAQEIIRDTFEAPFDKGRFTGFVKNLLNRIEDAPFTYQGKYIPDAYRQYIKTLERIGKFTDGENSIDILVITLLKETSLERARTMQRNFVAWYLNGSRGGEMKDAAIVAYVSPDKEDWRFSLVKMEYKLEKTATGKMKVEEDLTPARRWSFLVGSNEKSHTAQSRLVNILLDDENAPTLAELEESFDIETVTKEFFLKYRELFIRTKEALDRLVNSNPRIEADFNAKGVDTVNFSKKLLGQIVFLYFLQKKGWFGVGRDAEWGTGSWQFLRELFEKRHGDYRNFFNDILEPLFYEALRIDRSHDDHYYSRFDCKIPFLNGGLFDPIANYDWVHTDVNLPDKLFSNRNKTKEGDMGDGILDVFDRYNFTVKEDEPLEKEVAIDPELLGKAYEKFNAIRPDNFEEYKKALKSGKKGDETKFNKQFGVYYTPREIVHYMCRQSLINYLYTELNPERIGHEKLADANLVLFGNEDKKGQLELMVEHREAPAISREDIEILINIGEHVSENEARVLSKGRETKTYYHQLPEGIRKNAELIDQKLADITVCDPAVGSGAFPVGMMSEILKTRNVLSTFINPPSSSASPIEKGGRQGGSRTAYDFKHRCIEHSLYGVDIDPGAVEIAKLRLWLSLVVDEDDIKNIKPLPNLDYKIVCGNSLFGVEKNLFNFNLFNDLERLKPQFFNETNPTKKQEFKRQIDDLIFRITNGHKEFDFEVYFSEVFREKEIVKNWQAYHVTWVTHNSRISERMIEYEAVIEQKRISKGLHPIVTPIILNEQEEIEVASYIAQIVKEDGLRIIAYNICRDHVHLVLVCEGNERDNIVRKLKGKSTQRYKTSHQIEDEFHLWAQKYSWTIIRTDEQLSNTIMYIQNNRMKHKIPDNKGLQPLVEDMVTPIERAFNPIIEKGGFDVVIANPPYIRQESIKDDKPHLAKAFNDFFCGTADIYTYFYKQGIDILKPNGHLCFIAPNKFMRAGYGKNTRVLLTTQVTPRLVIDFGDLPIFEATTYPSIILVEKRSPHAHDKATAATFMEAEQIERLDETLSRTGFPMPVSSLKKEGWNLEQPEVLALMEKFRSKGVPLAIL